MDLIFKRYADPYTLLDTMIDNQSFDEFVCTFVRLDDDDKLWDMYIHKCWENISFKGLKELGCNGPVTEAIDKMEKHLNKAAHDQE